MTETNQSRMPKWDTEETIPILPAKECDHFFERWKGSWVKCKKCGTGLIGVYILKEGKPMV